MIIVLAKATAKKGMVKNIIDNSDSIIKNTRLEKGCIEYNLFNPIDSDNTLLFVEKWENENDLKSHLKQPHFLKFGSDIEDYLVKDLEITVFSADEINL